MSVDIIVVSYKTDDLLRRFIDSYRQFTPTTPSTLTVIDVATTGNDVFSDVEHYVPVHDNCGYSLACNLSSTLTDSDVIAFFNADTAFVDDRCVDRCVEFLNEHEQVAVVGPLQYSSERRVTHAGIFGTLDRPEHRGWQAPVYDAYRGDEQAVTVSGAAYFIKRSVWDELTNCPIYRKGFPQVDGAFLPTPHFWEETYASYHAQAHGYEVWYLGSAEMIHEWKQSPAGEGSRVTGSSLKDAQAMFRAACDEHDIPHD